MIIDMTAASAHDAALLAWLGLSTKKWRASDIEPWERIEHVDAHDPTETSAWCDVIAEELVVAEL